MFFTKQVTHEKKQGEKTFFATLQFPRPRLLFFLLPLALSLLAETLAAAAGSEDVRRLGLPPRHGALGRVERTVLLECFFFFFEGGSGGGV